MTRIFETVDWARPEAADGVECVAYAPGTAWNPRQEVATGPDSAPGGGWEWMSLEQAREALEASPDAMTPWARQWVEVAYRASEPEPEAAPVPPDVAAVLGQMGERFGFTIQPLVDLIRARDEVIALAVPRVVALQESLGEVLQLMESRGIQANWATEVRTLENARALLVDQPTPTEAPE